MRHRRSAFCLQQPIGHRRGAVFAYAMTYVTLSLLLLGLMGTMLHLVLRSSETDRQLVRDLARVRDAEQALRADARRAAQVEIQEQQASFADAETVATWTIDRHLLNQQVVQDGRRDRQKTIRFRRGTLLSFVSRSEQLIALRVTSPAAAFSVSERSAEGSNQMAGRTMEIVLNRPSTGSVADNDAAETSP